jgi:hypothetical protein
MQNDWKESFKISDGNRWFKFYSHINDLFHLETQIIPFFDLKNIKSIITFTISPKNFPKLIIFLFIETKVMKTIILLNNGNENIHTWFKQKRGNLSWNYLIHGNFYQLQILICVWEIKKLLFELLFLSF